MTTYHTFEGKVFNAKVYEPEVAFHKMQWTTIFEPKDDAELAKIVATGVNLKAKKNPYNDKMQVSFRRPVEKDFGNEVTQFNPPAIYGAVTSKFVDKETKKGVYSYPKGKAPKTMGYVGNPDPITNGSDVKITISVYETGQGKGHRLESIYVTELAPEYVKQERDEVIQDELPDFISNVSENDSDGKEVKLSGKAPW